MNSSLIRSSTTQLKIVVLALLASIAVAAAGIMSRPVVETTARAQAAVDVGTTMITAQNRSSTVR
jgi:uncharacterized protein YwlG (UPF0340 family)